MKTAGINPRPIMRLDSGIREKFSTAFAGTFAQRQALVYLVLMVAAAVTLVHLPSLSAQARFHDDADYVITNPLVQNPSWRAAGRFFREVWRPSTVRGYYQPLTMVSLMLDRFLSGPHESLRAYHCTSLALHVANTALLAVLLYLLFGRASIAAGVALLFGLHPVTVESVCWIAERKTVLASFFALWSLIAHVRFAREAKTRFYVACILTYLLALLSKPITVPLPLMMLLLDYWPLNRLHRRSVLEKAPFFVVAAAFAVITYVSQSRTTIVYLPGDYNPLQVPLILCHNIVFYLSKALYPANLSAHYGYATIRAMWIGVVGTGILIPVLILSLKWTRALAAGWLIFFVMVLPSMGIVSVTPVTAANRYLYLPSIGLVLVVAWFLAHVTDLAGSCSYRWAPAMITAGLIVAAGGEAKAAQAYMAQWRDSVCLHRYMLAITPHSAILCRDLGAALSQAGRTDEAIEEYRRALVIQPRDALAHLNLAAELAGFNETADEAISHYREAAQIDPTCIEAHLNLAGTLLSMCRVEEAVVHAERAVQLNPEFVLAQYNLGKVLAIADRAPEGLLHLREAIRVDPGFTLASRDLAWLLATHPSAGVRDANEAIRLAEQTLAMTGERDAAVLDALAAAYALDGRYRKAVETAEKAFAIAKRTRDYELADQIQERLRLYQFECPYYEDPKVQLERMVAKAKRAEDGGPKTEDGGLPTENCEPQTEDSLEISDEADAIVAQ